MCVCVCMCVCAYFLNVPVTDVLGFFWGDILDVEAMTSLKVLDLGDNQWGT